MSTNSLYLTISLCAFMMMTTHAMEWPREELTAQRLEYEVSTVKKGVDLLATMIESIALNVEDKALLQELNNPQQDKTSRRSIVARLYQLDEKLEIYATEQIAECNIIARALTHYENLYDKAYKQSPPLLILQKTVCGYIITLRKETGPSVLLKRYYGVM